MIARFCLAALAVCLLESAVQAQALRWTPVEGLTGPESRPAVQSILQTPGGAQVAASAGLYRRTGGDPWTRATVDSLRDVSATALASQGAVVYASTVQFGVLRSDDDGRSWRGDGLGGTDLAYVVALPDGALVAIGSRRDVYRKDADGAPWAKVGTVGVPNYIFDDDIVVLGNGTLLMTAGLRLMRSVDRGSTWTDTMRLRTSGVAVARSGSVFIVLSNGRVERSDDSGATWSPVGQVPASYIGNIVVADGALLVAAGTSVESGILRSETGSMWAWIHREPQPYGSPGLFALGAEEPWVYVTSSGDGLIRMDPASGAWTAANSGFVRETYVGAVVRAGPWLVFGSGTHTYRTRDDGVTWANTAVPGNYSDPLFSLPDATLLLGSHASVLRSGDAGETWEAVPVGQGTLPLPLVRTFAQTATGTLLAGAHVYTSMPAYGDLYRSSDGGTTWARAPMSGGRLGPVTSLAQTETGTLFSGHQTGGIEGAGGGLARSDDDGTTWTVVHSGSVVALAPLRGGRLLVGVRGHDGSDLYRSSPSGEQWEALGRQPGLEWSLFRAPDGAVYLTGYGTGVRRSFDDGTTWEALNDGLGNRNTTQLTVGSDGRLYVGTYSGLFRSERPAVAAEAPSEAQAARLEAPRPNPVARRAVFAFSLAADADVDLGLYDVLGRRVATVASGRLGAGRHEAAWERGDLAPGVYLAVLRASGEARTQRVTVAR